VVANIRKKYLTRIDAYAGAHARLKEMSSAYQARRL
jgi:hypothetical protein